MDPDHQQNRLTSYSLCCIVYANKHGDFMNIRIHPHARARMRERGATDREVVEAIRGGESSPARHGRTGFRRNFAHNSVWRGKRYTVKQVEVIAVQENEDWLVITVPAKFF